MQSFVLKSILISLYAASSLAVAIDARYPVGGISIATCNTPPPPAALSNQTVAFGANQGPSAQDHAPVLVNTYFHVVTSVAAAGTWTQSQLTQQISAMNKAYKPFNIAFTLAGTYADLNIYFLSDYGLNSNAIGVCNYPVANPDSGTRKIDGCIVRIDTLPEGAKTRYNMGMNAAHETGHWFGIHHPFDSHSCDLDGDGIADTPYQSLYSFGCPIGKDTCPNQPGVDNIHNIMDYTYDACKTGFTPGQGAMMLHLWDTFRAGK